MCTSSWRRKSHNYRFLMRCNIHILVVLSSHQRCQAAIIWPRTSSLASARSISGQQIDSDDFHHDYHGRFGDHSKRWHNSRAPHRCTASMRIRYFSTFVASIQISALQSMVACAFDSNSFCLSCIGPPTFPISFPSLEVTLAALSHALLMWSQDVGLLSSITPRYLVSSAFKSLRIHPHWENFGYTPPRQHNDFCFGDCKLEVCSHIQPFTRHIIWFNRH